MKSVGEVIDKLLNIYDIATPVRQHEALFIWEEVVGEVVARHTQPEKISYGKLYIKVDSPSWRNELNFQKKEILQNLNARLKNVKIKEIVLR